LHADFAIHRVLNFWLPSCCHLDGCCRDYLAPIITPHEAFLAFTGRPFDAATYRLDFEDLLDLEKQQQQQQQQQEYSSSIPCAGGGPQGQVHRAGNIRQAEDQDEPEQGDGEAANDSAGMLQLGQLALTHDESGGAAGPHVGNMLTVSGSSYGSGLRAGSRTGQQVQARSAAQYLTHHRSYRGLETPAVGAEIKLAELAVKGRSGRAAGYVDEPSAS
jgi:hypothetical protein